MLVIVSFVLIEKVFYFSLTIFLLSMILHLFQQVVRQLCKMNTARHGMEQVGMGGFQTRRPPRSFSGTRCSNTKCQKANRSI